MILDHFALSHICDNCPLRINKRVRLYITLGGKDLLTCNLHLSKWWHIVANFYISTLA